MPYTPCMGDFRSGYNARTNEMIEQVGWMVQYVAPSRLSAPFAYSIGFRETFGAAEILITSLPPAICHSMFASIVERLRNSDLLEADTVLDGILEAPYTCALIDLDDEIAARHMLGAVRRCQLRAIDFQGQQLLWPDADNKLPGQAACHASVELAQRLN